MADLLLVRYGELALKSPPVRREFERTLRHNLLAQFQRAGAACRVRSDRGHLYVEVDDVPRALPIVRRVFGVTSVSAAREVPTDRETIRSTLLAMAEGVLTPGRRFAIRARRTGQHPFSSQELAAELGAAVLERWPERHLIVDLDDPEVELTAEVRGPKTYLYTDRSQGPGGLPLGVAGRVVALVDGVRGALGAYLMMKRGCRCALAVRGAGEPLVSSVLERFDPTATRTSVPPEPAPIDGLLREIAERSSADGIVLPIGVEEFPLARELWGDRPVFSPTVGLSDEEVAARWRIVTELGA